MTRDPPDTYTDSDMVLYNSLPDIVEASRNVSALERSVIPTLADLLVTYGLHPRFNICLIHKHFSLLDRAEKVVNMKGENISVSSVFKDNSPDPIIVEKFALKIPTGQQTIVPDTFLVRRYRLIPYEFCCLDKPAAQRLVDTANNVDPAFLRAWQGTLVDCNFAERCGLLAKIPEVHTNDEKIDREISDSKLRVNVKMQSAWSEAFGAGIASQAIPTSWEVKKEEGLPPVIRCSDVCFLCSAYCPYCQRERQIDENGCCTVCGGKV